MRVALVNPSWSFGGSIYFGCRAPHLPIELGAADVLLRAAGHDSRMFDGHILDLSIDALAHDVAAFSPDLTIVTTAPSYLFWRCAQPELRVPREFLLALGARGGRTVAIGPHGSVTPEATLRKLGCDLVLRGEPEEAIVELANGRPPHAIGGSAAWDGDRLLVNGAPRAAAFCDMPAIAWPDAWIARHTHHHHRFEAEAVGPGAEVEASRGCPYSCTFCAKIDYRDAYRRRALDPLLAEIDALVRQGVTYLYFIDEIFLPQRPLLEALVDRPVQFGVQTRIDLWKPDMLDLLGDAGCVSIEAGVESLTAEGRAALDKNCRMDTDELAERLIYARRRVPFVQANLIEATGDEADLVAAWRERLQRSGVWANDPVPLYPYPSSPAYRTLFGPPGEDAWERAHTHYLARFERFSDIQDERPAPLAWLEHRCGCA